MDLTFKELEDHFKNYSELSGPTGLIRRLCPGTQKNFKAFVQWTRDPSRLGHDPSATHFPINQVSDLQYKTHKQFQLDSKTLTEAGD
jgi:hypothetical protein